MKTLQQSLTLALVGLFLLTASSHATLRTWTGLGTGANWSTTANWDTIAPANNGDSLTFSGSTQLSNTNDYSAITNTAITFSTGGWVIGGNKVWLGGNITSSLGTNVMNTDAQLTAARTITVSANQLTMNGVISGGFGLTKSGVGTLVLTGTNTYTGATTISASAGIVKIASPNALGAGSVSIPRTGATTSGYLQLDIPGSNTIPNTFSGFSSANSGETATPQIENLSGTNKISSNLIVTGTGGNGLVVRATGGLLILAGTEGSTQASRLLNLIGVGNGMVNGSITNGQSGTAAFPVLKDGPGTWTLNGTNIYTGATTINKGTLVLGATGTISNSPAINVAPGAVFDVSAKAGGWLLNSGQTIQCGGVVTGSVVTAAASTTLQPGALSNPGATQGTLSFSNNLSINNTILRFNLSSDPTGLIRPSDQIVVNGDFSASGVNTFTLGTYLNGYIPNGTYKLVKFGGALTGDASNFAVTGFTVGARGVQGGYIVTNIGSIDLVVTGTPPGNLVWQGDGAANSWDVQVSSNWLNAASLDLFYNYDAVTFDDSATNQLITIAATVTPGSVTVNATNNYAITDTSAAISGLTGLTKLGSGTLTISNSVNNYTGVSTFSGGIVQAAVLANGLAASSIGAAAKDAGNIVLNGGTLEYTGPSVTCDRGLSIGVAGGTFSVADSTAVATFNTSGVWNSGGRTFTKAGPGTLAFSFQQNLDGTNYITGGILKIPTVNLFSVNRTIPVFINGGGLDINAVTMEDKPVVVSGVGDLTLGTTNGAIINSSATGQNQALRFVTLTGDSAFGGAGRWDIRANPTASLSTGGNAYNLIKVGANQISLVGVTVDAALADIDVREGTFGFETGTTSLGNPTKTLTVRSSANFQMWAAANALNKQIVMEDASILIAASGVNTINGPVSLPGSSGPTFNVAGGVSLNLNGVVSGTGGVTKSGNGTLSFAGTNTYTGTTTVNAGKLVVNSAQNGNGDITIADGAALGVTVSGAGAIAPNSLTLGSAGATTLEFSTLASTTVAPIYATNLNVYSVTNTINILSGNLLAGQTYPLINSDVPNFGAGFILGVLPPLVTATLVTNGNTIALNVTASSSIEIWSGAVNGIWDIGATANWKLNGAAAAYANGNNVQFDDTALSNTVINLAAVVQPKGVIANNSTLNYSFTGNAISGTNSLTKLGSGSLTLYNANTYSGGTTLSAGTLNVDHDGALGSGAFTILGGSLDNNGGGSVTLTNHNIQNWNSDFTFIGNQNLNLGAGAVTLNANRTLTLSANTLTVGGGISDGGNAYALIKNGAGTLVLAGKNTYSGGTTVNAGTLVLQASQTNGGVLVGPTSAGGTLTIASGAALSVATTNHLGVTNLIQVGNTSPAGTTTVYLRVNGGSVTNHGSLLAARASYLYVNSGSSWLQTGDMEVRGVGGYSGDIAVETNAVFTYTGLNSIKLNSSEGNSGNAWLDIGGSFNTPVAFEQTTVGVSTGQGLIYLYGGGTLKLTAAVPELNPLGANPATVKFITGGAGGTIDTAGYNTVINDDITGSGRLTKAGAGVLTLISSTPLSYTNDTLITGGTLVLSNSATLSSTNILIGGGAKLDVSTLATQPFVLADYQVLGNLSSTAVLLGSVDVASAPAALSLAYAAGTPALNIPDGTLTLGATTPVTVNNTGAALGNGNYKLISVGSGGVVAGTAPAVVVVTGNGMGAGGTATLNLAGNELYLTVTGAATVNTTPPVLTNGVSGGNLNLSWPTDHIGWRLLVQTNHLTTGVSSNTNDWSTVAGSASTNQVAIPIDAAKPTEFYRLVYP